MKYLVSAVVFILVAIVPFGSWYYLQTGLNYRKEALEELKPKQIFDVDGFEQDMLRSKTTILQLKPVAEDALPEIYEQYENSETFQVHSINPSKEEGWAWTTIDSDLALRISEKYNDAGFVLVDTSMMIRNTYPADMDGIRRIIEHTSIVLPRIKEMDIKMKK